MTRIALTVNGKPVEAEVAPRTHLADFLREHLLLTGTHIGCEHGICGACTVEIDGEIARSCITYAVTCDGAHVRTIEGFDDDALMERLRQAFTHAHALQCGYCTPGMLIAARDLVRRKGGLSRYQIRVEMSGNLCRCTGYQGIVDAIEAVMASSPSPRSRGEGVRAAPVARVRRAPIAVTVGEMQQAGGETRITQSFVLPHARDAVWRLMSDVEAVAPCMPGLALDGPPQGDKVTGRLEARIGPIVARFAGEGTIRQPQEHRQVVEGRGGDRSSGSRAAGSVDYRLAAVPGDNGAEATRVDVIIAYALTGPLAQFGRSGLVRDLVRRIGEAFAQNLDAKLADPAADVPRASLGGLSLAVQIILDRLRGLVARLLRPRH
jgi:carbon-monoxide dehydrogenase small subunit